jgi:hypothetical protein
MNVSVTITLAEGDDAKVSAAPADAAVSILELLGGDPEKDSCSVQVSASGGTYPPPPEVAPLPAP